MLQFIPEHRWFGILVQNILLHEVIFEFCSLWHCACEIGNAASRHCSADIFELSRSSIDHVSSERFCHRFSVNLRGLRNDGCLRENLIAIVVHGKGGREVKI